MLHHSMRLIRVIYHGSYKVYFFSPAWKLRRIVHKLRSLLHIRFLCAWVFGVLSIDVLVCATFTLFRFISCVSSALLYIFIFEGDDVLNLIFISSYYVRLHLRVTGDGDHSSKTTPENGDVTMENRTYSITQWNELNV